MEDPITFDLWGSPIPDRKQDAIEAMTRLRADAARVTILRELVKSAGGAVLIAQNLAWVHALTLRDDLRSTFDPIHIYQNEYGPADMRRLHWCPIHAVYFAGVVGCHVCSGFIAHPAPA